MTPQEIYKEYSKITNEGAKELAMFLNKWGGVPTKDFVAHNEDMVKDGLLPHERVRRLFGSAYDWFAYGN